MPSRREEIAMSPEEIGAYLSNHRKVILTSNGPNGYPHPMPMNYLFRDHRFFITTFRRSQKIKNLERDPKCALLVESGDHYSELQSVLAYADAEIVDDFAYTNEIMNSMGQQEAAGDAARLAEVKAIADASAPKRVVLRLKPDKYVSWDHTKLHGRY
jgi:nitroimidazol reductase NimA-like FMN-containing flavoprotein (pyridoxamine 5'-phosphate oxidase superfamily)